MFCNVNQILGIRYIDIHSTFVQIYYNKSGSTGIYAVVVLDILFGKVDYFYMR